MPPNRSDSSPSNNGNNPPVAKKNESLAPSDPIERNRDKLQHDGDLLIFAQQMFESSNNGFFEWFVPTNRFRYSESFGRMLGYQPDELDLSEASISSHIHQNDFRYMVRTFASAANNGEGVNMQLRLYNKLGELRWYKMQLTVHDRSNKGHTKTALGCVTDIHDIKLAQEESLLQIELEKWLADTIRNLLLDEKPGGIRRCLNTLCEQFDLDICLIREVNSESHKFKMVEVGQHSGCSKQLEFKTIINSAELPFDVESFLEGNAYVVSDVLEDQSLTEEMKSRFINNVRSFAAIPIYYRGKLDYFLSLMRFSSAKHWSPDILRAAELCGDAIALIAARQKMADALSYNEERFQHALDASQDGIWDWDISQHRFTVTPSFLYMLGYDEDFLPLTGEKINQLFFPPITIDSFFQKNNTFNSRTLGRFDIELPMRHKSGETVWVSIRGKQVSWDADGMPTRCAGENQDISFYKLNQQRLLNKARTGLQYRLQEDKNKSINGIIYSVESDRPSTFSIKNWLESETKSLYAAAETNSIRLNVRCSDNLIEPNHQEKNLIHLALSAITKFVIAHQKNTHLDLDISTIKNTEEEIILQFVWRSDKHIESLEELGPSIGSTEYDFQECLNPFLILGADISVKNNTILGLNIIAIAHFPQHKDREAHPTDMPPSKIELEVLSDSDLLASTTVLLAEDNIINQKVAIGMLQRKGIKVTVANNGREAIDILLEKDNHYFDLVLMDMDMPILDGYAATQAIRGNQHLSHLPVIAVTAHTKKQDREQSLAAGVIDHIDKPIKPENLYSSIIQALKQ